MLTVWTSLCIKLWSDGSCQDTVQSCPPSSAPDQLDPPGSRYGWARRSRRRMRRGRKRMTGEKREKELCQ